MDEFGYLALIAAAGLPVSQTPILIVCALLGMPLPEVLLSIFIGKLAKYALSAKLALSTANELFKHWLPSNSNLH